MNKTFNSMRSSKVPTITVNDMIHVGRQMFARYSFDSVSLSDLAAMLQCTRYTLQQHFPSKSHLLFAVANRVYHDLWVSTWCGISEHQRGIEQLKHLLDCIVRYDHSYPDVFKLIASAARQNFDSSNAEQEAMLAFHKEVLEGISIIMHKGQQDGTIRKDQNPLSMAKHLSLSILGYMSLLRSPAIVEVYACAQEATHSLQQDYVDSFCALQLDAFRPTSNGASLAENYMEFAEVS